MKIVPVSWRNSLLKRFWEKVDIRSLDECWVWKAGCDTEGYGNFSLNGKQINSHRVAWEQTYGRIPRGKHVLHKCDNPPCCNPGHLFLGNPLMNARDRTKKERSTKGQVRGQEIWSNKLKEQEVTRIRHKRTLGCTLRDLAAEYGVDHTTIWEICKRRIWKHI